MRYYKTRDELDLGHLVKPEHCRRVFAKLICKGPRLDVEAINCIYINFLINQIVNNGATLDKSSGRMLNILRDRIQHLFNTFGYLPNDKGPEGTGLSDDKRMAFETGCSLVQSGRAKSWINPTRFVLECPIKNIVLHDPYDDIDYPIGDASLLIVFRRNTGERDSELVFYNRQPHDGLPFTGFYSSPEEFTHPYLSIDGGRLCYGEASTVAQRAFDNGDMISFLDITETVLRSYSPRNPHWRISQAPRCYRCGDETRQSCHICRHRFCGEHGGVCSDCGRLACAPCRKTCSVCGQHICKDCALIVRDYYFCRGCVETCTICGTVKPKPEMRDHALGRMCVQCLGDMIYVEKDKMAAGLSGADRLAFWQSALDEVLMEVCGVTGAYDDHTWTLRYAPFEDL